MPGGTIRQSVRYSIGYGCRMIYLLVFLHIVVCVFLVIVVLLQSGKAADLAGAFGGMGSQTTFGPRGSATVLSKATTIAAALFMVTSLSLAVMQTRNGGSGSSVLSGSKAKKALPSTVPTAAPAPTPLPGVNPATPGSLPIQAVPAGQPVAPNQPAVEIVDEQGKVVKRTPIQTGVQPGTKAPSPAPAPVPQAAPQK